MSGENYPCVIKVGERYYPQLVRALLKLRARGYSPVVARVGEVSS